MLLGGCGSPTPTPPQTTTITVIPTPSTSSATTTPTSSTSSTTAAPTPPTTFAAATARLATGTVDAAAGNAFTSPSGNIFCTVSNAGGTPVGCELKEGRIAQKTAGSCPTGGPQDIGRIEFLSNGPTPICNSDSIIQVNVPALKYGSIGAVDGSPIRCLSETIGMTCVDTATQHGFFIARNTYTVF